VGAYIAGDDALDQFFCRHPDEFLERPVEAAILDHENERIQLGHTLAAAYERPLGGAARQPRLDDSVEAEVPDDAILGPRWRERADALVAAGQLRRGRDGRYLPRGPGFPAGEISLRSASPDSVAVVERASGELLGSVEAERAFTTVHPGAVYLHLGRSYEVRELDIERRRAVVDRFDGDWYTQPKKETEVYIERIVATRQDLAPDGLGRRDDPVLGGPTHRSPDPAIELRFGDVSVTEQVMAYQRKRLADHSVIDLVALELPETNFPTQALWYVLPDELAGPAALPPEVQLGALHATEHSQIAVLPLLAMCDRWDIGGLSTNVHFQTGMPTIFVYDGHPGGVGIARRGFERFERLLSDAARLVGECPCESGCPSCVQSPKCGNLNEPLHKAGALELMEGMINAIAAAARPRGQARATPP
jgi:DEAD/DEAH box helicase domain-containing protein